MSDANGANDTAAQGGSGTTPSGGPGGTAARGTGSAEGLPGEPARQETPDQPSTPDGAAESGALGAPGPSGPGRHVRVVLVDDHTIVREGLRLLLRSAPDIAVVGEADSGLAAIDVAGRTRPDIVVLDLDMPGSDGMAALRQIILYEGQRFARRNRKLQLHDIQPRHHLRDRMLDLQACIHLQKVELTIRRGNEFHRPGVHIAHRTRRADCCLSHLRAHF